MCLVFTLHFTPQYAMSASDEVVQFDDESSDDAPSGGAARVRSPRVANPLVMAKVNSFPFFLENVVENGAVAPNASWQPAAWSPCKRGKFYPVSGPTGEGEALLADLVQRQRAIAESQAFRNPQNLADVGYRSLLSDEKTGHIVSAFWEGEYDRKATVELVAAFLPEAELAKLKVRGSLGHLSKKQTVAYLTGYRVPLLVFDDMEALVRAMAANSYERREDLKSCADSYVESFLLCSDEDLLLKPMPGKHPLSGEEPSVDDGLQVPQPLGPPLPKPLTTVQLQKQVEDLEAALRSDQAELEASAVADRARSDAESIHNALTAKRVSLEQEVARLRAEKAASALKRSSAQVSPANPLFSPPYRGAPSAMRPVDEFLVRTMSEITGHMKYMVDKAAAAQPGTALSPYDKRVKLLDDVLSGWGYVPFADYDVESLKELQTRLPSRKSKAFKLVGNELRVNEDDDLADSEAQHMGHWKQGCQFVLARMVKHPDTRVSRQDVITDRIAFFQEVNDLSISNGPLKLKTVNEFLRRMAVIKAELWMPEFEKNHLLFTKALLSEAGGPSPKKRKSQYQQDESADKRQKHDRKKSDSPYKPKQSAKGYQGPEKNRLVELTAAERVTNGPCPSRSTKGAACPCKGPPRFCKFTHECPRHPGEFHSAKECNKI